MYLRQNFTFLIFVKQDAKHLRTHARTNKRHFEQSNQEGMKANYVVISRTEMPDNYVNQTKLQTPLQDGDAG